MHGLIGEDMGGALNLKNQILQETNSKYTGKKIFGFNDGSHPKTQNSETLSSFNRIKLKTGKHCFLFGRSID